MHPFPQELAVDRRVDGGGHLVVLAEGAGDHGWAPIRDAWLRQIHLSRALLPDVLPVSVRAPFFLRRPADHGLAVRRTRPGRAPASHDGFGLA